MIETADIAVEQSEMISSLEVACNDPEMLIGWQTCALGDPSQRYCWEPAVTICKENGVTVLNPSDRVILGEPLPTLRKKIDELLDTLPNA